MNQFSSHLHWPWRSIPGTITQRYKFIQLTYHMVRLKDDEKFIRDFVSFFQEQKIDFQSILCEIQHQTLVKINKVLLEWPDRTNEKSQLNLSEQFVVPMKRALRNLRGQIMDFQDQNKFSQIQWTYFPNSMQSIHEFDHPNQQQPES